MSVLPVDNYATQSAPPAANRALALIKPIERVCSGSFKMIIKSAPARGMREKPMTVNNDTLERRALSASAQRAEAKAFILMNSHRTCERKRLINRPGYLAYTDVSQDEYRWLHPLTRSK